MFLKHPEFSSGVEDKGKKHFQAKIPPLVYGKNHQSLSQNNKRFRKYSQKSILFFNFVTLMYLKQGAFKRVVL